MPTIAFASSKGGAGKSTSAVLLATELAGRGASVTIIDADPNQPVSRWSRKPGRPDKLAVVSSVTEETLIDAIDAAARKTAFVIVDLEGTASLMVAQAMSRADLVVIPTKGSELDAIEAIKVIKFIGRQEKAYNKAIPFAVLFTQTNPAVRPRTLKSLEQDMLQQGIPLFGTALHDRDAFRAIFSFGGSLSGLDPNAVGGVPAALNNARQFTAEAVAMLTRRQPAPAQAAEVAEVA
jgi:chromosome partitioning protein